MDTNIYKLKVSKLIKKAEKKGLIKTYSKFCDTKKSKEYCLNEEEIKYYKLNKKEGDNS